MLDEEEGVKVIQYLQLMVGVKEDEEVSRKNWRAMSDEEKEQTECVYIIFKPIGEPGVN
jgi:hypothetical protein